MLDHIQSKSELSGIIPEPVDNPGVGGPTCEEQIRRIGAALSDSANLGTWDDGHLHKGKPEGDVTTAPDYSTMTDAERSLHCQMKSNLEYITTKVMAAYGFEKEGDLLPLGLAYHLKGLTGHRTDSMRLEPKPLPETELMRRLEFFGYMQELFTIREYFTSVLNNERLRNLLDVKL